MSGALALRLESRKGTDEALRLSALSRMWRSLAYRGDMRAGKCRTVASLPLQCGQSWRWLEGGEVCRVLRRRGFWGSTLLDACVREQACVRAMASELVPNAGGVCPDAEILDWWRRGRYRLARITNQVSAGQLERNLSRSPRNRDRNRDSAPPNCDSPATKP